MQCRAACTLKFVAFQELSKKVPGMWICLARYGDVLSLVLYCATLITHSNGSTSNL